MDSSNILICEGLIELNKWKKGCVYKDTVMQAQKRVWKGMPQINSGIFGKGD